MYRRKAYLQNGLVLANSGEKLTDVTVRDPITVLWVLMEATNGGTTNKANTLYQCIDAIEIIDGSEVLMSLDGKQALALACYQMKRMPPQVISELPGNPHECALPITFGRFWGDPQYAFDPTKYRNPQVRFKWNLANVNAVGASGFLTDTGRLTLVADVMEGVGAPRGLMMSKEWYSWTTTLGGVEYIDLPRDFPYRALLIRAEKATSYVDQVISKLKFNCDGGKVIPFELDTLDWLFMLNAMGYRFDYRHVFHQPTAGTCYPILKYEEDVQLISENNNDAVFMYPNYGYGEAAITVYVAGAAYAPSMNIGAHIHGMCPFRFVYYPFGLEEEVGSWFDPTLFGSVRLEATGATASGVGELVITQVKPY